MSVSGVSGNAATKAATSVSETVSADEIKQGVVDVFNKVTGSSKTIDNLTDAQLTEDLLFAGHALADLRKSNPKMAENMLNQLGKDYKQNVKNEVRQPLFSAVDGFLKGLVDKGKLTKARKAEIVQTAHGKAQLDDNPARLGRKNQNLASEGQNNIDATMDRVAENTRSTKEQMSDFRARVNSEKAVNPERYKANNDALKNVFNAPAKPEETPAAAEPEVKPETPAPVEDTTSVQDSTPAELPGFDIESTGPDDFVVVPASKEDRNMMVLLSLFHSRKVERVEIVGPDGEVVEKLNHTGKGKDARHHFRATQAGSYYPEGSFIRIVHNDGTYTKPNVDSLNVVTKKTYRA